MILYGVLHCPTPGPKKLDKNGLKELTGSVHTAQRQVPTQIPTGFCTHFIGLSLCIGYFQCQPTIRLKRTSRLKCNHIVEFRTHGLSSNGMAVKHLKLISIAV